MSAKLINIVLDLETLGTSEDSAIIQIGCSIPFFDRCNVPLGLPCDFEVTIAYEDCLDMVELGVLSQEESTMKWWNEQDPKTKMLVFSGQDSYSSALDQLEFWLDSIKSGGAVVAIWGNGSDFDNRLLSYTVHALNYKPMWNFRNNRDLRTLKALFPISDLTPEVGEIEHTALGDARYEARLINHICKTHNLYGVL